MRQILLATALVGASISAGFANEPETGPTDLQTLAQVTQPQRVNWENKSDRITVAPVSAKPEQNNFAEKSIDPENSKR